jgi:hypothetical protein
MAARTTIPAPATVAVAARRSVAGVTQVRRRLPVRGREAISSMKMSAMGTAAAAQTGRGGTGRSGTRVQRFAKGSLYLTAGGIPGRLSSHSVRSCRTTC